LSVLHCGGAEFAEKTIEKGFLRDLSVLRAFCETINNDQKKPCGVATMRLGRVYLDH
jgi:hypothetical protein